MKSIMNFKSTLASEKFERDSLDCYSSLKRIKLSHDQALSQKENLDPSKNEGKIVINLPKDGFSSTNKGTLVHNLSTIPNNSHSNYVKSDLDNLSVAKIQSPHFQTPESKRKLAERDTITLTKPGKFPEGPTNTELKKSSIRRMDYDATVKRKPSLKSLKTHENDLLKDYINEKRKSSPNLMNFEGEGSEMTLKKSSKPSRKDKTKELISVKKCDLKEIFPFETFNPFQSSCFDCVWNSNESMIISAPPRTGKTVLLELAIAKHILQKKASRIFSMIYIAPFKALCQQFLLKWKEKFERFNLTLLDLTSMGESMDFPPQNYSANIIVTTPEKLDLITRRANVKELIMNGVSLLLIDNLHFLNHGVPGATLEAMISRIKAKMSQRISPYRLRIVAASDTVSNAVDLGEWLKVPSENIKAFEQHYFNISIEKHVFGYNMLQNEFQFERSLGCKLAEIIRKFSNSQSTLIFCQTQKGTLFACEQIIKDLSPKKIRDNDIQKLLDSLIDKNLQKYICSGIAFYNGDVRDHDKKIVKELFMRGFVQIICTTFSHLVDLNVSARLVIIQATSCYRSYENGFAEYSSLEMMQMIGRAQSSSHRVKATVVIMTKENQVYKYENQSFVTKDLESNFLELLSENINAEISLGNLKNVKDVIEYIKGTFFYIRLKRKPDYYEANKNFGSKITNIEEYLEEISEKMLRELHQHEMIHYDLRDKDIKALDFGKDVSRYNVYFATVKNFFKKYNKYDLKGLLSTLSEANEFINIRLKVEDQKLFEALNSNIQFPTKRNVLIRSTKIFILIQAGIGYLNIEDWSLKQQLNKILDKSFRILCCFRTFYLQRKIGTGFINCEKLVKFISMRTWEDNNITKLMQLPGITQKLAMAMCEAQLDSFAKIAESSPLEIENSCVKNPPFGAQLQRKVHSIPILELEVLETNNEEINLTVKSKNYPNQSTCNWEMKCGYYIIALDKGDRLHFIRYIPTNKGLANQYKLKITGLTTFMFPIEIYLINEKYVGVDTKSVVSLHGELKSNDIFETIKKNESLQKEKLYQLYYLTKRCSRKGNEKKKCASCLKLKEIISAKRGLERSHQKEKTSMTEDKLGQPQKEFCIQQLTLLNTSKHAKGEEKSILEKIKITKRKEIEGKPQQQFYKLFDNIFE